MPPNNPDGKKGKKQPAKKQPAKPTKPAVKPRGRAANAASPPHGSSPPRTPVQTAEPTPNSPRSPTTPLPHASDASDHGSHHRSSNQSVRVCIPTSSVISNFSQPITSNKKRAKRRVSHIPSTKEDALVEWVREHECLWDSMQSDYWMKTRDRLWQEKSEELGFSVTHLTIWFKSLRDRFTKLDKGTSDTYVLTDREEWIKNAFAFLRKSVRHRHLSAAKSVKAKIAEKKGDLIAAEAALAEQGRNVNDEDVDDTESMPTAGMPKSKGRGKRSDSTARDEEAIRTIQQRVTESVTILEAMKSATQQPVTSRTAFANYVRDRLLSMSNQNFKRSRKEMNRFLSSMMDEDDDDDNVEALPSMQPYAISQRQMTSPKILRHPAPPPSFSQYGSSAFSVPTSRCDRYQPTPNQWRMSPTCSQVSQQQHPPQYVPVAHQDISGLSNALNVLNSSADAYIQECNMDIHPAPTPNDD